MGLDQLSRSHDISVDAGENLSMPPLLWPAEPPFVNRSEHRVWSALKEQLGENDLLIANQHFTDHGRDYELDIAVVLDGAGVVVVEVKGGTVWNAHGQWWQKTPTGERRIDPVSQAMTCKHVLKDWVQASSAWAGRTPIRWAHAIALPDIEVEPEFDTPDCHRWMVIDTNDLTDVANRLRNILLMQDTDRRLSEPADAVAIHEALSGRFLPQREALLSVEAQVARHDEIAERLSAEQAKILDVVQLLHRVEVRGGAGSGKTWLAVEQARRLAKAGKRVALISYSRGLAEWMRRRVSTFSHNQQPAYVGTFHGIGKAWGAPDGSDDDSDFWESELPEIMLQLANEQPTSNLYDAIVIDEAQDFADSWWPVVLACLKYDDDALYVFSDEGQRIFPRFGDAPADLVTLVLDRNLRNTKQISQTFSTMAPNRMRTSTHEGPAVRFVPCSFDKALDEADDVVDQLIERGLAAVRHRRPGHRPTPSRAEAASGRGLGVLLGVLLGQGPGVLRPRHGLQGPGASRCCAGRQRAARPRACARAPLRRALASAGSVGRVRATRSTSRRSAVPRCSRRSVVRTPSTDPAELKERTAWTKKAKPGLWVMEGEWSSSVKDVRSVDPDARRP